jgi:hypothetical protein
MHSYLNHESLYFEGNKYSVKTGERRWVVLFSSKDNRSGKYYKFICGLCTALEYRVHTLFCAKHDEEEIHVFFNIPVTVHLDIILINNQLDTQFLSYIFISILYMCLATLCSSSGESIVSIQDPVYVTLQSTPSGMQVGKFLPNLHTGQSPTQSDIYRMSVCLSLPVSAHLQLDGYL